MEKTNDKKVKVQNSDSKDSRQSNFNWKNLYAEMPVEEMPWYHPALDLDLDLALNELDIFSGSFLDLGTGPGTQAIELQKKGFDVTGTDISKDAIERVTNITNKVEFIHDDILNSKLTRKFNYIFDRGCFHVMSDDKRPIYVKMVENLLTPDGILFLKCFSNKEPDNGRGPYRISKEMILQIFGKTFSIESIKDSEFEGNRKPSPKALFVIMKKKNSD